MLIKYKKATMESTKEDFLKSYCKGSYFKIKPNNKKVYSFLEKTFNCKIKNAYNLLDSNKESIGLVFCKILNSEEIGGVQISYIPLGEDGFYNENDIKIIFNGTFKNKEIDSDNNVWYYESKNIPEKLKSNFNLVEVVSNKDNCRYTAIEQIKGKKAAPKIIVRLSNAIKEVYEEDLGITAAFNPITFSDI